MLKDITISEAREELTALPKKLAKSHGAVAVTRRGKPVLAIMQWELYESIIETLEIMSDEKLMASLRKSIRDIKGGRTYSSEEVKKELGL
jgi:PHD/YefM family antitoxin component YafN of YafNO toxin-antitoxin module